MGRLKSNLSTPIPGLQLFHTPKSLLTLGRRWHKLMFWSLNAFAKTSHGECDSQESVDLLCDLYEL